jgi:uncharacterized Zn finger protein (UPF0148 family)
MASLFRRPPDDLGPLRDAVASLGTTSVPGLAAALSWRERRTEKALLEELSRPGTPLTYDPALRVVRWAPPIVEEPPAADPEPPALVTANSAAAPPRASVLGPTGAKATCPSCHVPLLAAATGSIVVCPNCGRLSTVRARAAGTATEGASEAPSAPARGTSPIPDRHSQELFAAYVTAKPIPCPRCRTPLRHKGISEYSCPACGETVRFASASPPPPASASRTTSPPPADPTTAAPTGNNASLASLSTPEEPLPNFPASAAPDPPAEVPFEPTPDVETPPAPPLASPEADPETDPGDLTTSGSLPEPEPWRAKTDVAYAYVPPPAPSAPSRSSAPKKSRLPRVRATCRVPPRFAP